MPIERLRRRSGADDGRDAQLSADDGRMARSTAGVRHDGSGAAHHRDPVRIGLARHQNGAIGEVCSVMNIREDHSPAARHPVAHGHTRDHHGAGPVEREGAQSAHLVP